MKKLLLAASILLLTLSHASAQVMLDRPIEQYGVNEKTVVVNDKGQPVNYADWKKLVQGGQYGLRPKEHDSDSSAFILYKYDRAAEDDEMAKLPKPAEAPFFTVGNTFRFYNMTDMGGNMLKPEDLNGKVVVVNFWFIACPPCRYEMPELNRVADEYKDNKDVVFVALSFDKKENVQRFLKVSPFKYQVIPNCRSLYYVYGVKECPISLVIDKTGVVRFTSDGYGDGNVPYWIRKTVDQYLQ